MYNCIRAYILLQYIQHPHMFDWCVDFSRLLLYFINYYLICFIYSIIHHQNNILYLIINKSYNQEF